MPSQRYAPSAPKFTQRVAFHSMPAQRRAAVDYLTRADAAQPTPAIAHHLRLPTTTTRRVLGDIAALRIIDQTSGAWR